MQARKNIWEYYDVLGLPPGASTAEIKHAYRRLVRQWHPDRFAHDPRSQRVAEEKLKEINEAYAAVSGARPGGTYTPQYQYRSAHSTQRASGSYSHSRSTYTQTGPSATGERRRSPGGFRYRSAYESPYYTYREVSPRGMPRWVMILIWFLLVAVINTMSHDTNDTVKPVTSAPTMSVTQAAYIPPGYDVQHLEDLQKQAQDAMNAIRLNDRRYRINFQSTIQLDDRVASMLQQNASAQIQVESQAQTQDNDVTLSGSQEKRSVRNYPVPPAKWPGFTPSVETPGVKAPSQENTKPSPSKEKAVLQPDPRQ